MMAYADRFVVSVLVDGKIQKEIEKNSVNIPFGSEYSIRLRNKHRDLKAVVNLFIDGEEQSKGGYIVPPNDFVDIERNSYTPKRFKFVEQDSLEAQDFGKDSLNSNKKNGIIEARFHLEKVNSDTHYEVNESRPIKRYDWIKKWIKKSKKPTWDEYIPKSPFFPYYTQQPYTTYKERPHTGSDVEYLNNVSYESESCCINQKESGFSFNAIQPGVTVEGSFSSQVFGSMNVDFEPQYTAIVVTMKGYHSPKESCVAQVAKSQYCVKCGAKKAGDKANFCHVCGCKLI